uniref:C6 finger domain n=1 Tax=Mycena chlorophos TaxID=658473 RepID=A0ABQ0L5K5_MYCCL|nr:C6 finger domain [Mycena chlorophos]
MTTSDLSSSPVFQKRRRAYIACSNCRKRKIKCVPEADYRPCARCSKKGLVCEYISVADSQPDQLPPPPAMHSAPAGSTTSGSPSEGGYSPEPSESPTDHGDAWPHSITPPSAGLQGFLPSRTVSARASSRAQHPAPQPSPSLFRPLTWPTRSQGGGAQQQAPVVSLERISQPRLDPAFLDLYDALQVYDAQAQAGDPYAQAGSPVPVSVPVSVPVGYGLPTGVAAPSPVPGPVPGLELEYPHPHARDAGAAGFTAAVPPPGYAWIPQPRNPACRCPPGAPCYCGAAGFTG